MQRIRQPDRIVVSNLFWLAASLGLAFFVWIVASTQADPISVRRFNNVTVQIEPDPGLLVVNNPTRTVRVNVRAQQSVLNLLTQDDIVVRAELDGKGPGTHIVELDVDIARRAVADTQPAQITITLETIETRLIEVQADLLGSLPIGFERGDATFDNPQIQISGAASRVQQVVAARVALNLTNQRTTIEQEMRPVPVDAEGNEVAGVTLDPQTVRVTLPIRQRDDVVEVPITPNIDTNSLPEGYVLSSLYYEPQTVFVSGNLSLIPATLLTQPISLANRTGDFEVVVPVMVPNEGLLVLSGNITVSIGITATTITRQFENVPVIVIGLRQGLEARYTTTQVTILVTGPQAEVEELAQQDLQAVIDLNGLGPGVYDRAAIASNSQGPLQARNISVLPATLSVTIVAAAESTETPAP